MAVIHDTGVLGRNNPEGAAEVYRRGLLAGKWTADDSRRILAMQDDPARLLTLIAESNKEPLVAEALARMLANPTVRRVRSVAPQPVRADAIARDYHGRFAPGPHHEQKRVERVRSEATTTARVQGHADHVARGEHEAHLERQAIANEHRALAAGHISAPPTAKLAAYDAVHARILHEAAQRLAHLDEHQGRAAAEFARLRVHPDHGDVHDPVDAHESASEALGHVAGHGADARTSYEPGNPEHTGGSYHEHAAATQTALEQLHEDQVRAIAETHQAIRDHDRAARGMQRELEHYEEHGVKVAEDHPEHAAARAAVESLSGAEGTRRSDISEPLRTHLEDAHAALRDAARETATTVRELAQITGRSPRLAGGKPR